MMKPFFLYVFTVIPLNNIIYFILLTYITEKIIIFALSKHNLL